VAKEGAAIMTQIKGLLGQFMELGYDTPVKQMVEQSLMPAVDQAIDELHSEADAAQSPDQGPPDEGSADQAPDQGPPEQPGHRSMMADAREKAKSDMQNKEGSFAGDGPKGRNDRQQAQEEEQKKKKAKAY